MSEGRYELPLDPVSVRVEMARRDWTRRDLAREVGLSEGTIRRALRGQYSVGTAWKIGLALTLIATSEQEAS